MPNLLQVEHLKLSQKEIDHVNSVRRLLVVHVWAVVEQYATRLCVVRTLKQEFRQFGNLRLPSSVNTSFITTNIT